MKNNIHKQIEDLKKSATSKEDLMSQLASFETGEISPETQQKINGGQSIRPPFVDQVLGIFFPPTIPALEDQLTKR